MSDPPFDDEVAGSGKLPARVPAARVGPRSAARVVPLRIRSGDVPDWSREDDVGVCRTPASDLEPANRAASVLARALVEVLGGRRPVEQLRIHCAPDVFAGVRLRQLNPIAGHPRISAIRVCEPADGVAEVCAVMRFGDRGRALAFRLQGLDGRWRIIELQLG